MSQTPAISPSELRAFAVKNFDFESLYKIINDSLKRSAEKRDVEFKTPIKVSVKIIPQWVIDKIIKTYEDAGWKIVRVAEDNGQFCTFEFFPD